MSGNAHDTHDVHDADEPGLAEREPRSTPSATACPADAPTLLPLETLALPLRGRRLIEASAGTGKTYTIAALYLRLVLGHGVAGLAFARPLQPEDILVVTFTEAATLELRDRIRRRLDEAAAYFADGWAAAPVDPLLTQLRDDYPDERWDEAAHRLRLAAEAMDDAAISTIHGWCYRMLREFAFDSDMLFELQLEQDPYPLMLSAAQDYWRQCLAGLPLAAAARLASWWSTPDALLATVRPVLTLAVDPASLPTPAEAMAEAEAQRTARLAEAKAALAQHLPELRAQLFKAIAAKAVDGRKLQQGHTEGWLDLLQHWLDDPEADAGPALTDSAWARLSPDGLDDAWKEARPSLPVFDAVAQLRATVADLPDGRAEVLRHATAGIAAHYQEGQRQLAMLGFDDLLIRLDAALRGPAGYGLALRLRRQFPVALIDEFQDTDPVQFRIFDRVYPRTRSVSVPDVAQDLPSSGLALEDVAAEGAEADTWHAAQAERWSDRDDDSDAESFFAHDHDHDHDHDQDTDTEAGHDTDAAADAPPETALVLIGDPKQAIYAFRGADLDTYLRARATCDGCYTLTDNYRSRPAVVAAVNHVFLEAEERDPAGAFRLGADSPYQLGFLPVQAGKRFSEIVVDAQGDPLPGMTLWTLDGQSVRAADARRSRLAEACAAEIARLLIESTEGRSGWQGPDGLRPVRPGDCAVLVNTGREAEQVRAALSACGVPSVYLSESASVYASVQAEVVQRWLAACADPGHAGLLRAALATEPLGLDWVALEQLQQDEPRWEQRVLQFRGYREIWLRQGVLPMLRHLLHDFAVPARLLDAACVDGERQLTNLLHLAELLQQAAASLDGAPALLRHLDEQREEALRGQASDERQLRLESDADRVMVVTVHKSKGLEYPLVFVPYGAYFRGPALDEVPMAWRDARGRAHAIYQAAAVPRAALQAAARAETVRKAYVALTRASQSVWWGVAWHKEWADSAPGHLIGPADADDDLAELTRTWAAGCPDLVVAALPEPALMRWFDAVQAPVCGPVRQPQRSGFAPWWIASYTGLLDAGTDHEVMVPDSPAAADVAEASRLPLPAEVLLSGGRPADGLPALATSHSAGLHDLPRGADTGNFLHSLLDWLAKEGMDSLRRNPAKVRDQLARRCVRQGWLARLPVLEDWLSTWLETPLALPDAAPLVMAELSQYQTEMEFWLPVQQLPVVWLDRTLARQTLGGRPRPSLRAAQLQGMIKGYIDLVCEHDGRYYLIDYKSNWLGADAAAYTPEALAQAMGEARYDVQAVLYVLALHRLLRQRLLDYDYDTHVGGACYLFLRGLDSPGQGVHLLRPPRALIEQLDRALAGDLTLPETSHD